uniref:Uncharacterized protein n=1 Tax=Siphoviridae sp. ctETl1 TaxID=2826207 RepID=A0A8S5QUG6_9CAUD|nr:MAG TPA: hypothetical protein [Siphoviridae sp. ctETl1]
MFFQQFHKFSRLKSYILFCPYLIYIISFNRCKNNVFPAIPQVFKAKMLNLT